MLGTPKREHPPYEHSDADKRDILNGIANKLLTAIEWRVTRYNDEVALGDTLSDSVEKIAEILRYKQDVRNVANGSELDNTVWPSVPS
jgi:hypothetical protein